MRESLVQKSAIPIVRFMLDDDACMTTCDLAGTIYNLGLVVVGVFFFFFLVGGGNAF